MIDMNGTSEYLHDTKQIIEQRQYVIVISALSNQNTQI